MLGTNQKPREFSLTGSHGEEEKKIKFASLYASKASKGRKGNKLSHCGGAETQQNSSLMLRVHQKRSEFNCERWILLINEPFVTLFGCCNTFQL